MTKITKKKEKVRKLKSKVKSKKDPKRTFSAEQKLNAFVIQKGLCFMCSEPLDRYNFIAHHNKNHAAGGKTTTENCRLVCANCSASHHRGKTPTKKSKSTKKTVKKTSKVKDMLLNVGKKNPLKNTNIPSWI